MNSAEFERISVLMPMDNLLYVKLPPPIDPYEPMDSCSYTWRYTMFVLYIKRIVLPVVYVAANPESVTVPSLVNCTVMCLPQLRISL